MGLAICSSLHHLSTSIYLTQPLSISHATIFWFCEAQNAGSRIKRRVCCEAKNASQIAGFLLSTWFDHGLCVFDLSITVWGAQSICIPVFMFPVPKVFLSSVMLLFYAKTLLL